MKSSSTKQNTEQEKCPHCGNMGLFIPPSVPDHKTKKLSVKFKCPNGHTFTKEFDLI